MAADLSIHILEGITEEDLATFMRNTFGSKHFSLERLGRDTETWDRAYERVAGTPAVEVGEVSWLKAAVFGDAAAYVPGPVQAVCAIIGEDLPAIDEALIARIASALRVENTTGYAVEDPGPILGFLRAHLGKRCFTVSW